MTITRSLITRALSHPDLTWYKNVGTSIFRVVTMHAFDRQTDRQTDGQTDGQKCIGNTLRCITRSRTVMKYTYRLLYLICLSLCGSRAYSYNYQCC